MTLRDRQQQQRAPQGGGDMRTLSLKRILLVKVALLLAFLIVVGRLVQIQVVDSPRYQEIARKQHEARVDLPAMRGQIFDRNGKLLVSNTMFVSYSANPRITADSVNEVADMFGRVFNHPRDYYREKLTDTDRGFVWLERRVPPHLARHISARASQGLLAVDEPRRLYHYDHVGGQMIGFTDIDNKGLSGIELELEPRLHGTNGYVIMQKDGLGRKHPSVDYPRVEPTNGNNVELTIDIDYQSIVEQELAKGVERSGSESGVAVMLDPATGEVLAMANFPSLNPNQPSAAGEEAMKNRAVTDMFEPGSVFKVVTASAALEKDAVKPSDKFYGEMGRYEVVLSDGKKRVITDTHEHGLITFEEAMEVSSNIVFAKISNKIGAEPFYTTARNFGFGIPTGIELPGEVGGDLKKPSQWWGTTLNNMAYGYDVAVTPLQVAAAYATVANHGVLMKPTIIKRITDPHGAELFASRPQEVRRVISKETAATLNRFFEEVVEKGTGLPARTTGFSIAGKTGTSRKAVDGSYELGSYRAWFVGYFPSDDPKVVCLVLMDNPKKGGYTGGQASAPVFKSIAEKIYAMSDRFSRRQKSVLAVTQNPIVPDVTTLSRDAAVTMLRNAGFDVTCEGEGSRIVRQTPAPGQRARKGQSVTLATAAEARAEVPEGFTIVPDVRRMPLRRAVNKLTMQRLDMTISGSGIVAQQTPAAGQQVRIGTRVAIACQPRPLTGVSLY